jgi:hypothetical protein
MYKRVCNAVLHKEIEAQNYLTMYVHVHARTPEVGVNKQVQSRLIYISPYLRLHCYGGVTVLLPGWIIWK